MLSVRTRSLHRSTVDGFWFSPSIKYTIPFSSDNDGSDSNITAATGDRGDEDSMAMFGVPPVHDQLLSGDCASFEALKGYDHTRFSVHKSSSLWRELSAEMQRWLLDSFGEDVTTTFPSLVRVPSRSSLELDDSGTGALSDYNADEPPKARGVSFAPEVTIQPIPRSSELSPSQRRRMHTTSSEVRRNRARNKKEFRYDGFDWKAATEEPDMDVHAITGEEVHPAHGHRGVVCGMSVLPMKRHGTQIVTVISSTAARTA